MAEIYSKSPVRAIGNLARTPIKTHKGDKKWPLFVNNQLFWQSPSITLDNNNDVLADFLGRSLTNQENLSMLHNVMSRHFLAGKLLERLLVYIFLSCATEGQFNSLL